MYNQYWNIAEGGVKQQNLNPSSALGQAQTRGGFKPVNDISTLPIHSW
jgi:hypothetical protein